MLITQCKNGIKFQEMSCSSLNIRTCGSIPSSSIILPLVEEWNKVRGGGQHHQEFVFDYYIITQLSSVCKEMQQLFTQAI